MGMGTIKAKIVDDPSNQYREFTVHGYGKPTESVRWGNGYVQRVLAVDTGVDVWYLNSAGYAQRFIESRPPFAGNSLEGNRLLLIPNFNEEIMP